ncbi:ankyrin repeat-containing protein ITN1-like [Pistacia vera]|uniref:ankyrin repeat-containing protein ITN1-like n=1 Tax=Pistacia vera TaxID=55513 RepID=UPI001263DDA6|nr:ankyrin repeat-containing protein ITN1-like [Pistacia vera]
MAHDFVKKLLEKMNKRISCKNNAGNMAFFLAAASERVEIVKAMMKKNEDIVKIRGDNDIYRSQAALIGDKEMVKERNEMSLRDRMNEREQRMNETKQRRKRLGWLCRIKEAEYTGQEIPNSAFELFECLWEQVMLLDDSQILEIIRKPWSLIFEATKQGNLQFLNIIFSTYPDLMFEVDENQYTILHFAIMYRSSNIFTAMCDIGLFKDFVARVTNKKGNNILHLATNLSPVDRPDVESPIVHLKMAIEMEWFERVKRILHPVVAEAKNKEGKTARAIFTEQHKELRNKVDKWTKKIANACIMESTLIATMVFAALFTIPSGTNEEIGTLHFVRRASFIVFAISDTIALLLSCSSLLMFLAVISSRCEDVDFLRRVLYDLGWGLQLLLFFVEAMMVVFCATMFIVFKDGFLWMPILLMVMAIFAIFLYVGKTYNVAVEVSHSIHENW